MAAYGEYEPFKEHHGSARSTVWQARRARGSATEVFAVKVYRATAWEADAGADLADALEGFCESAEEQGRLARDRPGHWVPVLHIGRAQNEACWVGPFYGRSLESLMAGRVELGAADFAWLANAIVRGLVDLESVAQRPHGNLKPANIFIGGRGRLRGADVLLSDLKPRSQLAPGDGTADRQALGRMLVYLVRRWPDDSRATIGWPLEQGNEWKRLDEKGDGWRELCNALLAPDASLALPDLDVLARRVAALAPTSRRAWLVPVTATASLGVLAAGTAMYLRHTPYESLAPSLLSWAEWLGNTGDGLVAAPPEWEHLCLAYFNWLGALAGAAANRTAAPGLQNDAYLRERVFAVLAATERSQGSINPLQLAGITGDLRNLAKQPPAAALRRPVMRRVQQVWSDVQRLQAALVEWPERVRLEQAAQRFAERGWTRPSAEVREAAERGAQSTVEVAALTRVLTLALSVAQVEKQWAELARLQEQFGNPLDPVLAGARDHYQRRGSEADSTAGWAGRVDVFVIEFRILLDLTRTVDYMRFKRESFVQAFRGPVEEGELTQWAQEIRAYANLTGADDPRLTHDWSAGRRRLQVVLAELSEVEQELPVGAQRVGARYRGEEQKLAARVDRLLQVRLLTKDALQARRESQALQQELVQLESAIASARDDLRPDPSEWLTRVRRVTFGGAGSPLDDAWRQRRDAVLAGRDVEAWRRDPVLFRTARAQLRKWEEFFVAVAGPKGLAALTEFDRAALPERIAVEFSGRAAELRTVTIKALVAELPAGAAASLDPGQWLASSEWRARAAQHENSMRALGQIAEQLGSIDEQLSQGFGWDEGVAAAVTALRAGTEFEGVRTLPSVTPTLQAIAKLTALGTERSVPVAEAATRDTRLSVALAGWRRLGALGEWTSPTQIGAEADLISLLRTRVDREIRDRTRRVALREEIEAEALRRWQLALRKASTDEECEGVLAWRERLGIPEANLTPRDRFNLQLRMLKQTNWSALDEAAALKQRDDAVAALRTFAARNAPELNSWCSALAEIPLTSHGVSDPRQFGPGSRGWEAVPSADLRRLTYYWRAPGGRRHELTFVLIESPAVAPFYLCTTEFSVGLLIDLVAASDVRPGVVSALSDVAGGGSAEDDPRSGPRGWMIRNGRLVLSAGAWTGIPLPEWPRQLYPDGMEPVGPPTAYHPAQYIPPGTARMLADGLGCRLPTPGEWSELLVGRPANQATTNRRDVRWQRVAEHFQRAGAARSSPLEGNVFRARANGSMQGTKELETATADDGYVWFAEVNTGADELLHLFGNVAEYLHDGEQNRFYVAGGSALSPSEIDPVAPQRVDLSQAGGGFSDVGLRLAFGLPGGAAERHRLHALIRQQPYLR